MDYYQGGIQEYLTADRRLFVCPEYCIVLGNATDDLKGRDRFVNMLSIDLGKRRVYLSEVTFAKTLSILMNRR